MAEPVQQLSNAEARDPQQPGADPATKRSVPAFAANFPDDPRLQELVDCFERGQYNVVRKQAETLARETHDSRVAEAARELRRRLDPDPLAVKLLLASVALLVVLTLWAYSQHLH